VPHTQKKNFVKMVKGYCYDMDMKCSYKKKKIQKAHVLKVLLPACGAIEKRLENEGTN
jgi:hypothetical protein